MTTPRPARPLPSWQAGPARPVAVGRREPAPRPRAPQAPTTRTAPDRRPLPPRDGQAATAARPQPPAPRVPHARPHPPSVGDRRGLTALGAVVLALALGTVGGLWDVLTGPGLRSVFAVFFVAGCALATALVHREDLRAAVVMPPLVYVALALLGATVERAGAPGSFLTQSALELANALVLGAPVLLLATALAVGIAVLRGRRARRR